MEIHTSDILAINKILPGLS